MERGDPSAMQAAVGRRGKNEARRRWIVAAKKPRAIDRGWAKCRVTMIEAAVYFMTS